MEGRWSNKSAVHQATSDSLLAWGCGRASTRLFVHLPVGQQCACVCVCARACYQTVSDHANIQADMQPKNGAGDIQRVAALVRGFREGHLTDVLAIAGYKGKLKTKPTCRPCRVMWGSFPLALLLLIYSGWSVTSRHKLRLRNCSIQLYSNYIWFRIVNAGAMWIHSVPGHAFV